MAFVEPILRRMSFECLGWSDSLPQLKIGSARSARLFVIRSRIAIYVPGYTALIGIPAISKSSLSGREFPARVRKMLQSWHDIIFYGILFVEDLRTLCEPLRICRTSPTSAGSAGRLVRIDQLPVE